LDLPGQSRLAAFSPDGRLLLLSVGRFLAQLYRAEDFQPVGSPLRHQDTIGHVAFSGDGKRLLTAGADRTVRVWDAATTLPLGRPPEQAAGALGAPSPPDGPRVATCGLAATVRLWEAATGDLLSPPLVVPTTDGLFAVIQAGDRQGKPDRRDAKSLAPRGVL